MVQSDLYCRVHKERAVFFGGSIGGNDPDAAIECPVCGVKAFYEEAQKIAHTHKANGFGYSLSRIAPIDS